GGVEIKGIDPGSRVVAAAAVRVECGRTAGDVSATGCIIKQRIKTDGRVPEAVCVVQERVITQERVVVVGIAAFSTNCLSRWRKRKPRESEDRRDEKKTAYSQHCLGTRELLFTR